MPTPPPPASRPAPDRYAAERYKPTSPNCARSLLALQFDGQTLRATGTRSALVLPVVSGRAVDGRFDYSTDRQRLADQGPIPTGDYWIQPQELQSNAWYRLRNPRAAWGNHWITIHPYPATQTYGRGGFFIHGGSTPGSAGCIDLSGSMDRFAEAIERELEPRVPCHIPLYVRYRR